MKPGMSLLKSYEQATLASLPQAGKILSGKTWSGYKLLCFHENFTQAKWQAKDTVSVPIKYVVIGLIWKELKICLPIFLFQFGLIQENKFVGNTSTSVSLIQR